MLARIIFGIVIVGALKLTFDVGGFVLEFIGGFIKLGLMLLLIWAILSMFEGNFIPAIIVFGLPIAGIGYLIWYLFKRKK